MSEEWRPVVGYEGLYEVSDLGRVRGVDRTVSRQGRGTLRVKGRSPTYGQAAQVYKTVTLSRLGRKTCMLVHRLVAQAFIPNDGCLPQVNHKSGDKFDNSVNNLEWVSPSGNLLHACRVLGQRVGARHYLSKLDDQSVRQMRQMAARGISQSEIGKRFGVCQQTACAVIRGKTWKHVA